MLTFLRSSSTVLVMISSISVPIYNNFHGRRANSGKITTFKVGAPFSSSRSWRPPKPRDVRFYRIMLETVGYCAVKTRILYLTWA